MKYLALLIPMLIFIGCATQETASERKQQEKFYKAVNADADGLERSGAVRNNNEVNVVKPPKDSYEIDL